MIKKFIDQGEFQFDLLDSMNMLREFVGKNENPCVPCQLSDILKQDLNSSKHNCLGCSFNKIFNNSYRATYEHYTLSLSTTHGYEINREFVIYNCFHWLNLAIEQIKYIRKVIDFNGGDSSIVEAMDTDKYFDGFKIVNKITNLFKHPKVFAFTHHLEYIFEYENPNMKEYEKVNFNKIYEYFCRDEKNKEKQKAFFDMYSNRIIAIELPPLRKLVGEFLIDFGRFLEMIKQNGECIKILSNHSNL